MPTVILRTYMIRQVAITTALVLGFLVVMLLGGRLIRYFGIAAEGGLDVGVLFTLIGYNLPYFLELILPLSFFIGLMLVFGRMYVDHEMAVLVSSGISRGSLSSLLLPLGLIIFVIQGTITLIGKPWGVDRAANLWQEQSVVQIFDLIRPKEFISSGDYHLYVGELSKDNSELKDVIVISMNGKGSLIETPTTDANGTTNMATTDISGKVPSQLISDKDAIIYAKSATQVPSDDGVIRLDLHEGRRYEIDTETRAYSQVGFGRYRINLTTNNDATIKPQKVEALSTSQLITKLRQGQLAQDKPFAIPAELGYRLALPWLIIIAMILATPLATVRPRQGRWLKLIPAMFIFVANVLILISLKESISKGKINIWSYPVAVVLLMSFALYLNYHEHITSKIRLHRHNIGANT